MKLARPPRTLISWQTGVNVIGNRNRIVEAAQGEWILFVDDDHVFKPDLLARLLDREVDVVVPFCLSRRPPFTPVVYSGLDEAGDHVVQDNFPSGGLVEVFAAGTGGMLVRRHVLEAIDSPWFEAEGRHMNEDLTFCRKVREAGFHIWLDVDAQLGHVSHFAVWPARNGHSWETFIDFGHGTGVSLAPDLVAT